MNVNNFASPASVWAASVRKLTGFGTSMGGNLGLGHSALTNGSTVSIAATSAQMEIVTLIGEAAANATYNIGLFDGTALRIGLTGGSGAAVIQTLCGVSATLASISNSGTASGFYNYAEVQWTT